jgi:hypothetical protein
MGSMNQRKKSFYETINTNDIKSRYSELFLELRIIVNFHDLIGLVKYRIAGEYDPETASILAQLNNDLSQVQFHKLVYQDFKYWFEPVAGKKENYKDLSAAIYNWRQQIVLNNQAPMDSK